MADDDGVLLTADELASFAQSLDAWAAALPSRQRAFLRQVLTDALEAAVEDLSGFVDATALLAYHATESDDFAIAPSVPLADILASYVEAVTAAADDDPASGFALGG